ncbi:MAG: amidase [Promethearchaeota archaeon]
MKNDDILFRSAVYLASAIKTQEITATELVEKVIDRINKINPEINAICTPTIEIARESARKADEKVKSGGNIPPLNGIPTTIKDLMKTKGIRTTHGSLLFENSIPDKDDIAVKRLYDAGIVMLGKTNTPEFGYGGITDNKIFGVTRNPWDLSRTPGGSSGGAASAVACGLSPLALGSDGGGSIRHPSSFCGVFGIKPSFGRVPIYPRDGVMGETVTHYGPITRYVEDAALMLDVIKGPYEGDRYSLPSDETSYFKGLKNLPRKLKIGLSLDLGYAKAVEPDVEKTVESAAFKFQKLNWEVEHVKIKIKNPEAPFYTLYTALYNHDLKSKLKKWEDKLSEGLVKFINAGNCSGRDVLNTFYKRRLIYEVFHEYFKEKDILITPTVAVTAFEIGKLFPPKINGRGVSPTGWMPFTFPFNLTGHPAATVPAGFSKDGLPIGMQIIGRRFDDLAVLQVAKAFQEISPWQDKIPPICLE